MQDETIEGFRLSPQQKHLWLLQQDSFAYRTQCVIRIEGQLNVQFLKEALEKIVNRHETLRTAFHRRPGIKIPIQVIAESGTLSWQNVNLSDCEPKEQETKIEELLQEESRFIFDFEQGSLLRSSLVTISANQHFLLVSLPSLCADSWTVKNLVQEISNAYAACLNGEELSDEPIQYIQFSEWQNELLESEDAETGKAYWLSQDFWNIPPLMLPLEGKLDGKTIFKPSIHALRIESDIVAKIEANACQHNTTIAEFLFACWQILLWRLTGNSDIVVSTVFSGRKYEELHGVLGLLAKWLPVRCAFQKNLKFTEILSQISENICNNYKLQEDFVWEDSTEMALNAVNFPISFEFEEWPDKCCAGGVSFSLEKQYVCFDRFKVKLTCVKREESLITEFQYDANLFSAEDIKRLVGQFQTLVESAVKNPEATVSELEILNESDRHQLLVEFNNTQTNYPQNKCIHQLFESQVKRTPDNIAVVFENQQITYAELNSRANQLAHYLQQLGVKPEMLVGIYLERSLDIIIAILGILKAGGAYLPLDPALPAEGLALRLLSSQAPILLTQQHLKSLILDSKFLKSENSNLKLNVICLDTDWEAIVQESNTNPTSVVTTENLIYVLFTSGSTGKPKGVAIEHRQLLNYLHGILERLELPNTASFAIVSTFAADLGNTAIFPALCTGGCLHIISQERASDPETLGDYFSRHSIDCLKIVPSHLAALLASSPSQSILPRMRLIIGGETASWELVETIEKQKPNCQIINHYGPTETTVGVLTYPVTSKQASHYSKTVPLGRPLANTQVYVLDEQLRPVPIGVPGELYIGGAGLARGYLNQPELTTEKFISNPFTESHEHGVLSDELKESLTHSSFLIPQNFLYKTGDLVRYLPDGNIEFLGRTDHQVKIRGFRIELGEIEALLNQHPGVRQSVVSVLEKEPGNKRLVAYVVPNKKQPPSVSSLLGFLKEKLPEYMIPSAFIMLKALPLTPNGKVDYFALPAPDQTRPELEEIYVAPRTPVEEQLAEIWAKLLSLERVGIHDNFFELGGHSLLITQLLARVRDAFQVDLSLASLFEVPTVAGLADNIDKIRQKESSIKIGTQPFANLNAEAVLDPTICPNVNCNFPVSEKAILLTGATGFLGAFLLSELLQQTKADIYCLVRSPNIELGKKKLKTHLESYLLWNESLSSRIIPVIGDLSKPLLGLDEEQFRVMANHLDVIYHNGALVNFTYPYSALRAPNVLGTQEILRLACQIKVKPVHFISTIGVVSAVSSSESKVIREQDILDRGEAIYDGYTQSKWVAEKLVTIARERGVPVTIYRPGRISGHSQTGVCNTDDHTFRTIRGCIQLGSAPDQDTMVNLIPVDYASKAIVHLSRQNESLGKAFHLINPQPVYWGEIVNWIRSFGYPLQLISYDQWRTELLNIAERSPDNALAPLASIFSEKVSEQTSNSEIRQLDCQNTIAGLAVTSIVCPPVDKQLLSTYFSYLIQSGFLDARTLLEVQT